MPRRWLRAIVVAAVTLAAGPLRAQDKLDGIRSRVDGTTEGGGSNSSGDDSSGGSKRSSWTWSSDDDDDSSDFKLALFVITSPWTIPRAILEGDEVRTAGFEIAPYAHGQKGYLVLDPSNDSRGLTGAGRLTLDTGGNFDDVAVANGRLQLETSNRFGLDTSWSRLSESAGGKLDRLWLGDANLVWRFAQSERAEFYTGLGVNWLADHGDGDVGFNFTYGADFYPVKPIVVSYTFDLGSLGHASLVHYRTTIGAMVKQCEIFTGFDYLNVEGVRLPMGIAGLRFWF